MGIGDLFNKRALYRFGYTNKVWCLADSFNCTCVLEYSYG
jgi:hypothetical protein